MANSDATLFLLKNNCRLNPDALRLLIENITNRAGVSNALLHKFRHTFALTNLRSGWDVFTLLVLLGHGSLDMGCHPAQLPKWMLHRRIENQPGGQLAALAEKDIPSGTF